MSPRICGRPDRKTIRRVREGPEAEAGAEAESEVTTEKRRGSEVAERGGGNEVEAERGRGNQVVAERGEGSEVVAEREKGGKEAGAQIEGEASAETGAAARVLTRSPALRLCPPLRGGRRTSTRASGRPCVCLSAGSASESDWSV